MSDKEKIKGDKEEPEKALVKPEEKTKPAEPKPVKAEAASVALQTAESQPQKPVRAPFLGRRSSGAVPAASPISALAEATDTDPVVLGALKAAYGWTDRTKLTREEFLRLRGEWLSKPAKEE